MCKVHIAFQWLQAVPLMLHRMAFWLSGKVVALLIDNSTAIAYFYNQLVQYLFSFQSSLPNIESGCQAWLYTYCSIHSYPSQCGNQLFIKENVDTRVHLLPCIVKAAFQLWGQLVVDLLACSCTIHFKIYYTLDKLLPHGALGLNTFNHPQKFR